MPVVGVRINCGAVASEEGMTGGPSNLLREVKNAQKELGIDVEEDGAVAPPTKTGG